MPAHRCALPGNVVTAPPDRCLASMRRSMGLAVAGKPPCHAARGLEQGPRAVRPTPGPSRPTTVVAVASGCWRRGQSVPAGLAHRQAVTAMGFLLLQGCGHHDLSPAVAGLCLMQWCALEARASSVGLRRPLPVAHPLLAFFNGLRSSGIDGDGRVPMDHCGPSASWRGRRLTRPGSFEHDLPRTGIPVGGSAPAVRIAA